jgi:hypothetical protein
MRLRFLVYDAHAIGSANANGFRAVFGPAPQTFFWRRSWSTFLRSFEPTELAEMCEGYLIACRSQYKMAPVTRSRDPKVVKGPRSDPKGARPRIVERIKKAECDHAEVRLRSVRAAARVRR